MRDLENCLLGDALFGKLAAGEGQLGVTGELIATRDRLLIESSQAPADDQKAISGALYQYRNQPYWPRNTASAMLCDTMAPLIAADTETYKQLERAIFT